jgi:hypothetical protein
MTNSIQSPEFTLALNEEEREQLLLVLDEALRNMLVEAHRTESSDYRKHVERRETVLRGVSEKLRRP